MREFSVEIIETLQRTVKVDASSEEDAINAVKEQYNNEEIVLEAGDLVQLELLLLKSNKKIWD
ncbi:MAG: protein DpnD [Acidobacteria bacterium]|nr:MAG: protein DpnD [Acidobacteriota bacterium]